MTRPPLKNRCRTHRRAHANPGTEENPILWVFVPSREGEEVTTAAEGVADSAPQKPACTSRPSLRPTTLPPSRPSAAIRPKAHMGSLATFALITAADRGCAEPALVASRRGSLHHTGQIIAGADSGIESLADIAAKPSAQRNLPAPVVGSSPV